MSRGRKERTRDMRHHKLHSLRFDAPEVSHHDTTTPCTCPGGLHVRKNYVSGACQRDYTLKYKALLSKQ